MAKYYRLVDLREGYLVVTVLFSKQRDVQLTGAAFAGSSACPACAPLLLALPIPSGHAQAHLLGLLAPLSGNSEPAALWCIGALANSCRYRKIPQQSCLKLPARRPHAKHPVTIHLHHRPVASVLFSTRDFAFLFCISFCFCDFTAILRTGL